MSGKIDAQKAIERMREIQKSAVAWASRQAIGDAVLILLRDRELTRDALLQQLQRMAAGAEKWDGVTAAAAKGAEFIADPPRELPTGLSK